MRKGSATERPSMNNPKEANVGHGDSWKDSNFLPNEYWCIIYLQDIDSWFGSFPSTTGQWFVCAGQIPKLFETSKEAIDYINDNALIDAVPFRIARRLSLVGKKRYFKK